jgi:hypothetical protein
MSIAPWVSVEPATNPAAILGLLPLSPGTFVYEIPAGVVPPSATGILVFAYYAVATPVVAPGWWHFIVNVGGGQQNWFSLLIAGGNTTQTVTACNSPEFWLPMPVDGLLTVTFFHGEFFSGDCVSGVEIHGYYPG